MAQRGDTGGASDAGEPGRAQVGSDLDAMGQDKRRRVVGHSYGPSRRSQVLFFVIVASVLVVAIGGYAIAIAAFDQPQDSYSDEAPWSQSGAEQIPALSPSDPCGEPGNPHPAPDDSPCAPSGASGTE